MATNPRSKNGHRRRETVAWLKAQRRGCWICKEFGRNPTIDYSIPAGDPMSFECDELVPVSLGGSPTAHNNVDATHRRCNQWRSNKTVAEVKAMAKAAKHKTQSTTTTSKDWLGIQ